MNIDILNQKKGLSQFLSIIVIGGVSAFIIWPLYKQTKNSYTHLNSLKASETNLDTNLGNLNKQKELLKEYDYEIKQIPLAIPDKANEDQFIKLAQYAAFKNSVIISKINFIYTPEKISFDMSVEGAYGNILQLITLLNNAPRIIHIQSVNMQKSTESSFDGVVIVSIKGAFFAKQIAK